MLKEGRPLACGDLESFLKELAFEVCLKDGLDLKLENLTLRDLCEP